MEKSKAYWAGYDAAVNKPNTTNSNFGFFATEQSMADWSRGNADGKAALTGQMKEENYIPKMFNDRYVEMLIECRECPSCKRKMIRKAPEGVFPMYRATSQESQAVRANIGFISQSKIDDDHICTQCEKDGKASFTCHLCYEVRPTSDIQQSFGDGDEYLCKHCYETVPAKKWESVVKELYESHRYD